MAMNVWKWDSSIAGSTASEYTAYPDAIQSRLNSAFIKHGDKMSVEIYVGGRQQVVLKTRKGWVQLWATNHSRWRAVQKLAITAPPAGTSPSLGLSVPHITVDLMNEVTHEAAPLPAVPGAIHGGANHAEEGVPGAICGGLNHTCCNKRHREELRPRLPLEEELLSTIERVRKDYSKGKRGEGTITEIVHGVPPSGQADAGIAHVQQRNWTVMWKVWTKRKGTHVISLSPCMWIPAAHAAARHLQYLAYTSRVCPCHTAMTHGCFAVSRSAT